MPRGRHRHSPPLHRLLPPSAIAGVSLVCAFGPWLFTQTAVLRVLAAAAAVTAVGGAVVMRRWDVQAGRQVADLTRARAGDEWRFEERVAELETDLEESRELRAKLEQRLRAKRSELAGLRNEHASLLRRYATAETERASALEGRRLLEIEATAPSRALPPGAAQARTEDAATPAVPAQPGAPRAENADGGRAATDTGTDGTGSDGTGSGDDADGARADGGRPARPAAFSPEGRHLYRKAGQALSRLDGGHDGAAAEESPDAGTARPHGAAGTEAAAEDEAEGQSQAVDGHQRATAANPTPGGDGSAAPAPKAASPAAPVPPAPAGRHAARPESAPAPSATGHFTVPTAVAVVPPAPAARRPVSGGSFDFFGTQAEAAAEALDAVRDEDLADVVGQEALAERSATAPEPAPDAENAAGAENAADDTENDEDAAESHVIDLTAHDETEHIDVQRLRSAAS
ncbi:hypothetical protein ACIQU5_19050 [Streptomyces sp. NPDC090306]|uniref:hypothetical protein n=1 Tax=Streptomyces sp. NPDC090306 TaxID=3365961 RepID=UPI0038045CF6